MPAVVHTLHGFPFNEFHSPPIARVLRSVERRLARITDYFLTDGTMVASEAVRLKIAPPDRIRALISPIDAVTPRHRRRRAARPGAHCASRRREDRRHRRSARDAEGAARHGRGVRRPDRPGRVHGLDRRRSPREQTERRSGKRDSGKVPAPRRARGRPARFLPAFDVFALSSRGRAAVFGRRGDDLRSPVVASAVNSVPEIVIAGKTGIVSARPGDRSPAEIRAPARPPGRRRAHGRGGAKQDRRAVPSRRRGPAS